VEQLHLGDIVWPKMAELFMISMLHAVRIYFRVGSQPLPDLHPAADGEIGGSSTNLILQGTPMWSVLRWVDRLPFFSRARRYPGTWHLYFSARSVGC
jgi:hypothetical protein